VKSLNGPPLVVVIGQVPILVEFESVSSAPIPLPHLIWHQRYIGWSVVLYIGIYLSDKLGDSPWVNTELNGASATFMCAWSPTHRTLSVHHLA